MAKRAVSGDASPPVKKGNGGYADWVIIVIHGLREYLDLALLKPSTGDGFCLVVVSTERELRSVFHLQQMTPLMVSRDTRETALLVAVAVIGFLAANALDAPDVVTWGLLISIGGVGPIIRNEWRRRQDT
uniref:hypothetical protein n=1 Tax=Natrialba taiwanensis TaxID=160846 RepID=UPI00126831D2